MRGEKKTKYFAPKRVTSKFAIYVGKNTQQTQTSNNIWRWYMKRKGLILAMFVMPNSTLIMHMSSMSKVCGILFRAVGRSENPVGGGTVL